MNIYLRILIWLVFTCNICTAFHGNLHNVCDNIKHIVQILFALLNAPICLFLILYRLTVCYRAENVEGSFDDDSFYTFERLI